MASRSAVANCGTRESKGVGPDRSRPQLNRTTGAWLRFFTNGLRSGKGHWSADRPVVPTEPRECHTQGSGREQFGALKRELFWGTRIAVMPLT
jgi:hypothetical protein